MLRYPARTAPPGSASTEMMARVAIATSRVSLQGAEQLSPPIDRTKAIVSADW